MLNSSRVPQLRTVPEVRIRAPYVSEERIVFLLSAVGYLAAGAFLVFVGNVILGDALARVENIDRVVYSRDQHLAAIGFNFPPLPQILYLPFVPLRPLWPGLMEYGFIGNVYSAVFMAGAVWQVYGFMREIGVKRISRLILVATFALHPMVLFSGANGMTEAASLLFLTMAARHLVRWLRTGEVSAQVLTGVALSLAFLTRYEAVFSGLAVMALVAVVGARHGVGGRDVTAGLCDALILGGPLLLAVGAWVMANWMITGSPLAEVSNAYGTAQLHIPGMRIGVGLWGQDLLNILTMEPILPALLPLAALAAVRQRGGGFVATLAVFCPILAFMYWGQSTGNLLGALRYLITVVPMATLLCGVIVAKEGRGRPAAIAGAAKARRGLHLVGSTAGAVSAVTLPIMLLTAVPTAASGMWAQQGSEASGLMAVLNPGGASESEKRAALRWTTDRDVARYLDQRQLPRGSVLVDDFAGFAIFLGSDNPGQFVIASDRDFQAALVDPIGANVEYVLVPQPKDILVLEAVNRTYPGFYDNGAGIGQLVREFPQHSDGPVWRLYRVARPT